MDNSQVSAAQENLIAPRVFEATDLLETELARSGYAVSTTRLYLRACRRFSWWLSVDPDKPSTINESIISRFLSEHLPNCDCSPRCPAIANARAALRHLLRHFRIRFGEAQTGKPGSHDAVALELASYGEYLTNVCGVAAATKLYRVRYVEELLRDQFGYRKIEINVLSPRVLSVYVSRRASGCKPGTISVITGSIRSYLRFLQLRGDIETELFRAIPSVPKWTLSEYPTVLSEDQVKLLLGSFDRSRPSGIRDYAMALCMLRMGMRVSEVATLRLENLDWSSSVIGIRRTKSRKSRHLPITRECGQSLVRYLKKGRPRTESRNVFVRHRVPVGEAVSRELVRGAMRRAHARAGFPPTWTGTHLLRHTAAAGMYSKGATLKELADILGHDSIDTTTIYTKVNIPELRTVALPWPGSQI